MKAMTRRQFLKGTQQVGALLLTSAGLPRHMFGEPLGLPAGIQLYAVREPMQADPAGTLQQLYSIGYREVEAAGYGAYTAKEYRKFIQDAGLKCPSAHLAFKKGADFGPLFDDALALGCEFATSASMLPPKPAASKSMSAPVGSALGVEGFKYIADLMNDIGMKAKTAGLQYAYHNHSHEFETLPDGTIGYDYLLKQTDPSLVKFEIDCGWMSVAGQSPAEYMKRYPGRFRMLHIKDFKPMTKPYTNASSGDRPQGTELGKGFVDYKKVFAGARKAGIVHVFAEQEKPYTVSPMDSAKVDYDYLHSFS